MKNPQSTLPPGFRFHPTDEELIHHYLQKKVTSTPFPVSIIADVDIYKCDPWDLPAKAAFGEKEWYFFSPRDRKYPNGARPNRAAASGYWKATGTDKVIVKTSTMVGGRQETIGVKKALVFYKGRPPKGVKTNWIMHEYRLAEKVTSYSNTNNKPLRPKDSSMRLDNWVLCRIYKKSHGMAPAASSDHDQEEEEEAQFTTQETLLPMSLTSPISNKNSTLMPQKSSSFSNLLDAVDYTFLSNILSDNQFSSSGYESNNNSTLNAASATLESHQPFYNNIGYGNMSSGNNMSYNGSSLFQKLPQLNNSSIPSMENNTKRQISSIDHHEDLLHHPSKKLTNSCSFSNSSSTQNDHMAQYNFLNQPFLNQHLLLSPHLHFQG